MYYLRQVAVESFDINSDKSRLKYCGINSVMMCYPENKDADIIASVKGYVFFHIKLSFSVMDTNHIISYTINRINFLRPNLVVNIKYIQQSSISVEKYQEITIYF